MQSVPMSRRTHRALSSADEPDPTPPPPEAVAPSWKTHGRALALLAGLNALMWCKVLFLGHTWFVSDLRVLHYPMALFHFDTWKAGDLQLWNPYIFCGLPTGTMTASLVTYPPMILLGLALPTLVAVNLLIVLHFLLAGFSTYMWARALGLSWTAGMVSGIIFMFGGYLMNHVIHPVTLFTSAYLPLLLFFHERWVQTGRWRYPIAMALALGAAILIQHPQTLQYFALFLGPYALLRASAFRASSRPSRVPWGRALAAAFGPILFMGVAGALVGAAVLLPLQDMLPHTERGEGMSFAFAASHSWPPANIILSWMPSFFGQILHDSSSAGFNLEEYWGNYYESWGYFYNYLGVLPLALIVVALRWSRHPMKWAMAGLAAGFWILALGKYTPLFRLLYDFVPGFKFFRGIMRALYLTSLAGAMLAGMGVHVVEQSVQVSSWTPAEAQRVRRMQAVILACLAAGGLVVLFFLLHFNGARPPSPWPWLNRTIPDFNLWARERDGVIMFGFCTAMAAAWGWWIRRPPTRRSAAAFPLLTLLIVCADIFGWFWHFNPTAPRDAFLLPSFYGQWLPRQEREPFRVLSKVSPTPYDPHGNFDPLGLDMNMYHHLSKIDGYHGLHLRRVNPELLSVLRANPRLLDLANVKYLIVDGNLRPNPTALPRAFVMDRVVILPGDAQRLQALEHLDPRQTLLLEEVAAVEGLNLEQQGYRADARVTVTEYRPDVVRLSAELPSDGLLVLSDAYDPGWHAMTDGRPAVIYRADHAFRALPLRKGTHTVEFRYEPASFRWGVGLSAAAGVALAVMLGATWGRRTRLV